MFEVIHIFGGFAVAKVSANGQELYFMPEDKADEAEATAVAAALNQLYHARQTQNSLK